MKLFCENLSKEKFLPIARSDAASIITVNKKDGICFEITIPDNVLEWFISAHCMGSVVWQDWADYSGGSEKALNSDMRADISASIDHLLGHSFRYAQNQIEWFYKNSWVKIDLRTLTNEQ